APLGLAAARGVEERREPRWVELQLHERRPRIGWRVQPRVGVTERGASVLRVGLRVADGQAEPWRHAQLAVVRDAAGGGGGPGRVPRQLHAVAHRVAGTRLAGDELDARLVMSDVDAGLGIPEPA